MAASSATGAFGTLLKQGDGEVSEVFTTIAEVTNISGPSLSMDTIEVTNLTSDNASREFIAGLKDGGEVTIDLNFLPAAGTFTAFLANWTNRTKRNFKIVWSDAAPTTWSFSGYVTNIEPSGSFDDKLTASATIKITGQPTFA